MCSIMIGKKHVRKLDDHIFSMGFFVFVVVVVRLIRSYDYYCGDESLFS